MHCVGSHIRGPVPDATDHLHRAGDFAPLLRLSYLMCALHAYTQECKGVADIQSARSGARLFRGRGRVYGGDMSITVFEHRQNVKDQTLVQIQGKRYVSGRLDYRRALRLGLRQTQPTPQLLHAGCLREGRGRVHGPQTVLR